MIIEREDMSRFVRQTMDYVFLDRVDIKPGESAIGEKKLTTDEWFFKMHFPGNPLMPGVFQMEAIMQTAGLIINLIPNKEKLELLFRETQSVVIKKSARPGDNLKTYVFLKSYRRGIAKFHGSITINDELSLEMDFSLVALEEMVLR